MYSFSIIFVLRRFVTCMMATLQGVCHVQGLSGESCRVKDSRELLRRLDPFQYCQGNFKILLPTYKEF